MAVQQNKKSPSRRGHRRSHGAISSPALSTDSLTGELHRRHHLTKDGYYRGKKILAAVVNPLPEKKIIKRKPKADKPAAQSAPAIADKTAAAKAAPVAAAKENKTAAATSESADAKTESENKSASPGN